MFENIDVDGIDNPELKKLVVLLLNTIEQELLKNRVLTEEVQRLRDELARLKGGNPKPRFPSNKTPQITLASRSAMSPRAGTRNPNRISSPSRVPNRLSFRSQNCRPTRSSKAGRDITFRSCI